jgi:hypothetical protein
MPKQQTHVKTVREWCVSLGVLTAISITRQEAEMKLAAYLPLLMREFPDGAFTIDSLNHVARQCVKGFPTYPELANYLAGWWREHRPRPPALPPPPPIRQRGEPTPDEIEHVTRVAAETIAFLRSRARSIEEPRPPRPRHLTPEQLDIVNPLPNGRKRTDDATLSAAPFDPDASSETADEDETAAA